MRQAVTRTSGILQESISQIIGLINGIDDLALSHSKQLPSSTPGLIRVLSQIAQQSKKRS
jgi:hypothetical protein